MRRGILLLVMGLTGMLTSAAHGDALPYTNPLPTNPFPQPHPNVNPFEGR